MVAVMANSAASSCTSSSRSLPRGESLWPLVRRLGPPDRDRLDRLAAEAASRSTTGPCLTEILPNEISSENSFQDGGSGLIVRRRLAGNAQA